MRIVTNGKVSIYPTGIPGRVLLYHKLLQVENLLIELKNLHHATDRNNVADVNALNNKISNARDEYIAALKHCASIIQPNTRTDAPFFHLFKMFLERTCENDHTVLPQFKYSQIYAHTLEWLVLSGEKKNMFQIIGGMDGMWDFIGQRSEQAISINQGYRSILSETMDEQPTSFSLAFISEKNLEIQKLLSVSRDIDGSDANLETFKQAKAKYDSSATIKDSFGGNIVGMASVTYLLVNLLLSNAFKATYHAYRKGVGPWIAKSLGIPEYSALTTPSPPQVELSISEGQGGTVIYSIRDNGIGMTNDMLYNLFSAKRSFSVFGRYAVSGGKSMHLVPYMLDFLNAELHAKSEIGKGTSFDIILPKKLEFN
jgi:hypothetical protein